MLRAMMARHSLISAPTPPHLIRTFMPILAGYGDLSEDSNMRRLISDVLSVVDNQLGKWSSSLTVDDVLSDLPSRSFPELLHYVYECEANAQEKKIVFVKDNGNILWLAHLQANFESARFVYLVRDPRDCVLSWLKSSAHTGGLRAAAHMWRDEQDAALAAYALGADKGRVVLTRYEDIVANPEEELERICRSVGIEFEPSMIKSVNDPNQQEEAQRIKDWENLASNIKRSNFGKFEKELPRRKVRRIEEILGYEMRVLGYKLTGKFRRPVDYRSFVGKVYRAAVGSARLLIGGKQRRDELAIRLRRLRILRSIQGGILSSPKSIAPNRRPADEKTSEG